MSAPVSLIAFDELVPEMMMYLRECPDAVMKRELRRAARDFAVDTEAWEYTFPVFDVVAYLPRYSLNAGENARVHRIMKVTIDGARTNVDNYNYDEAAEELAFVDKTVPTGDTDAISDYDATATYSANDEVKYDGQYYSARAAISAAESWTRQHWQEIEDGMYVRCTLAPRLRATSIPAWFGDRYGDAIAAGAASRLLRLPAMPWTNLQLAMERDAMYRHGMSAARRENYLGMKAVTKVMTSTPD